MPQLFSFKFFSNYHSSILSFQAIKSGRDGEVIRRLFAAFHNEHAKNGKQTGIWNQRA
jgi:hypothetical protein